MILLNIKTNDKDTIKLLSQEYEYSMRIAKKNIIKFILKRNEAACLVRNHLLNLFSTTNIKTEYNTTQLINRINYDLNTSIILEDNLD